MMLNFASKLWCNMDVSYTIKCSGSHTRHSGDVEMGDTSVGKLITKRITFPKQAISVSVRAHGAPVSMNSLNSDSRLHYSPEYFIDGTIHYVTDEKGVVSVVLLDRHGDKHSFDSKKHKIIKSESLRWEKNKKKRKKRKKSK